MRFQKKTFFFPLLYRACVAFFLLCDVRQSRAAYNQPAPNPFTEEIKTKKREFFRLRERQPTPIHPPFCFPTTLDLLPFVRPRRGGRSERENERERERERTKKCVRALLGARVAPPSFVKPRPGWAQTKKQQERGISRASASHATPRPFRIMSLTLMSLPASTTRRAMTNPRLPNLPSPSLSSWPPTSACARPSLLSCRAAVQPDRVLAPPRRGGGAPPPPPPPTPPPPPPPRSVSLGERKGVAHLAC